MWLNFIMWDIKDYIMVKQQMIFKNTMIIKLMKLYIIQVLKELLCLKDSRDQVKKIYKPTIYRIILNVIYSFFGVILLFYLLTYFINNINVVILISLIFLICYYKIVIYDTYIIICIDDDKLIYKKRNKTKYYDINKCQFSAKIVNTTGDSGCVLYITDESGNFNSIDCELIGYSQFNNLLNDLKIIGDEARPIKIKTIMKGDED